MVVKKKVDSVGGDVASSLTTKAILKGVEEFMDERKVQIKGQEED